MRDPDRRRRRLRLRPATTTPATDRRSSCGSPTRPSRFPSLGVTGTLRPYDPSAGRNVDVAPDGALARRCHARPRDPGQRLQPRHGRARLRPAADAAGQPRSQDGNRLTSRRPTPPTRTSTSFGILELDDLRVGVQGLTVTFGARYRRRQRRTIYIATGGAMLFPGKAVNATITDRHRRRRPQRRRHRQHRGVPRAADLRRRTGRVDVLPARRRHARGHTSAPTSRSTARDFHLDTGADADQMLVAVRLGRRDGQDRLDGARWRGRATSGSRATARFATLPGFGVFLTVGLGDRRRLQVAVVPAGPDRRDRHRVARHRDRPRATSCSSSRRASPVSKGVQGLEFSGSIEGVRIDPSLLAQGEFPIIGIDSLGVTVKGKMFGGTIDAGLVGGILRLDSQLPRRSASSTGPRRCTSGSSTSACEGGFSMAGMSGFTIRLGLSELGPLSVFINVQLPGGILLEPKTGLIVNDFSAGVEFFKTLPSIDDPFALRGSAFGLPTAHDRRRVAGLAAAAGRRPGQGDRRQPEPERASRPRSPRRW